MTTGQRVHLMAELWPAACRVQGWKVSDRTRRIDVLSRILGRPIQSASDITTNADYDTVKRELLTLADHLDRGAMDTREEGRARRLRNFIRQELTPCLGLYVGLTPSTLNPQPRAAPPTSPPPATTSPPSSTTNSTAGAPLVP
jgi:hypothetical protein